MILLSINIPTYERLQSFSSVLSELTEEINMLDNSIKKIVQITILDNNSSCYQEKKALSEVLSKRYNINIYIKKMIVILVVH